MEYHIEVREQPERPVLFVSAVTGVKDLPEKIGHAYAAIMEHAGKLGEEVNGPAYVLYHNEDMDNLEVDMGFVLDREIPGAGDVKAGFLPAGREAYCLHRGPYHEVEPAYLALMKWVEEQGLTPTGQGYEFYLNSPMEVPESELLTEVAFPLG